MPPRPAMFKALPFVHHPGRRMVAGDQRVTGSYCIMVPIAAALFIALFGWGGPYFGWSDANGKVQLALFTTFVLGLLCGYKSRG